MNPLRRRPLLVTSALAAFGAAAIPAVTLPTIWRLSLVYGVLFTVIVLAEMAAAVALVLRPDRRRTAWTAAAGGVVLMTWVLDRLFGVLPDPDPWLPTDAVLGITDDISAVLNLIALVGLVVITARGSRPDRSRGLRIAGWAGVTPVILLVLAAAVVGVVTASAGTGLPSALHALPDGQRSTVEYCRPNGTPLPMDIYTPTTSPTRSAPVAVYVHGGGFMLGGREPDGVGASLANSPGALFAPLRQRLTAAGFVVASVDYRLAPASPWPGPITDVKCAIRFLKAHATELGIDPNRIAVWGSSAGGTLAALLGTTDASAGFDVGQYTDQTSTVQAVVDMFGPTDLTDFSTASGFARTTLHLALGSSADMLRTASPRTYVHPGVPPFLILHGTDDALVQQSVAFAAQLRDVGTPVTYIPVHGAGHELNASGQHPTPDQLTTTIVDFLESVVR